MSRIGLDEDVPTPVAPPHPVTPGRIIINQVQYAQHSNGATSSIATAIRDICAMAGVTDNGWTLGYETACARESSGNPSAINNYDLNAWGPIVADGYPLHCSRGIAQCIPDTFATFHMSGTSLNIYDTIANIAASRLYVISNYGVNVDGSNLASQVQQFDPNRPPQGYATQSPIPPWVMKQFLFGNIEIPANLR